MANAGTEWEAMKKWIQAQSLSELLKFQRGKEIAQEEENVYTETLPIPKWVVKEKIAIVTFTDGSQIACVSAIEETGACDTCANETSWTGYFIREK